MFELELVDPNVSINLYHFSGGLV